MSKPFDDRVDLAGDPAALPLPVIHVHSANAAVYTRMEQAIASIRRLAGA